MAGHIIAVDPGGVSGIADWSNDLGIVQCWEVPGGFDAFVEDWEWTDVQAVVCETYTVTPQSLKNTRQSDAQDIIGWLKGECRVRGIKLVLQKPADRRFGTKAKLQHLGWYRPSKGGHMVSAAAHLLTYLATNAKNAEVLARLREFANVSQDSLHEMQRGA
jgi:hypothetical protein